ncbi:MAG TPA: cytochrome c [Burkholderiales bacterium]
MRRRQWAVTAAAAALLLATHVLPQQSDAQGGGDKPYKVVDGNKVDPKTYNGFRAWRAAACERCHGANQAGLVGPSLLESLKRLSKEEVEQAILEGRPERGMPAHKNMKTVAENIDGLYAYLKGRSDGAIKPGRLEPIKDGSSAASPAGGG